MANHLRTELVLDALNMALHQRRPTNVIRTVWSYPASVDG
jgi:hypothetical protein